MTVIEQWVEVNRLAVAGREPEIARDVGRSVRWFWLRGSRFEDIAALACVTLTLGPDASAFHDLARARMSTGRPREALADFERALRLYRSQSERTGEAAARFNLATIHRAAGDFDGAIGEVEVVVELDRQVSHPDLQADIAVLQQARRERDEDRNVTGAVS
ncbi:tetratricopeptide (TPR) repeat protein [Actinoplanes campanulatus]|uniref:Tetratricopeptide (TPR) repeat protein n=1 Tax=Actinoplanes campanulatus TaxID=113559 RepID=A0A7W5AG95_9ACTN|nr:tetratricopeptide repeat protein [Actinoplanes campanulatus]MBB3095512.1 tetratricopeptide (TPR) repeat protein [Actinoplanes campanulatus]GGN09528.1 hypothetical protein GCM10010109_18850 [Actinoplanes campanulatus]GID36403.1 hypothetical protein Aca09nite_29090 [Actinoplanes campanulatus]